MIPLLPAIRDITSILNTTCGYYKSNVLLAYDVLAVAVGIRTGLLIDTMTLEEKSCRLLATRLRKLSPLFNSLQIIHEPISSQTLLVNLPLLQYCGFPNGSLEILDISSSEPILLPRSNYPLNLTTLVTIIQQQPDPPSLLLLDLPPNIHPTVLIPLAGWLLEYPVLYYLSNLEETEKNCLGGRELCVFRLTLESEAGEGKSHPLMSFSIPSTIVSTNLGGLDAYQHKILDKFQARLRKARTNHTDLIWINVKVAIETVEMERFAL